eukprot:1160256-Pelagomonas_calceolata.AAC.19
MDIGLIRVSGHQRQPLPALRPLHSQALLAGADTNEMGLVNIPKVYLLQPRHLSIKCVKRAHNLQLVQPSFRRIVHLARPAGHHQLHAT